MARSALVRLASLFAAVTLSLVPLSCGMPEAGAVAAQPTSPRPPSTALSDDEKASILKAVEQQVRSHAYATGVDFSRWADHLKKHQKALDEAHTMGSFSRVLNTALNEFGISHIDVMDPSTERRMRETSFGGIGITPQYRKEGEVTVLGVQDDGPADKAGLREGDTIIAVDGVSPVTEGMIRGPAGTKITLKVRRGSADKEAEPVVEELQVTRGTIHTVSAPTLTKVGEDAAVLRLWSFSERYERAAVEKLFRDAKDVPMLVIDLRSNGGGAVSNLSHFLSCLLPRGTEWGTFINRNTEKKFEEETKKNETDPTKIAEWTPRKMRVRSNPVSAYKGKVAVLINGGTASASEITAAAMRELREAPLVGSPSAGAVLMSTYVPLNNGFSMKVPISDYVTIKGLRIEGAPLEPDARAGGRRMPRMSSPEPSNDPAVKAALDLLRVKATHEEKRDENKEGE